MQLCVEVFLRSVAFRICEQNAQEMPGKNTNGFSLPDLDLNNTDLLAAIQPDGLASSKLRIVSLGI